jgi:hypothetical protein
VTVVASAKRALVGAGNPLEALLPKVAVSYSPPGDLPREAVYGGPVVGPVELRAMAGGARVKRREDLQLQLTVRVHRPGDRTTEDSDARAAEIGEVICLWIAANWTLGDVPDLKSAKVSGLDLGSWLDDDGAYSELQITVALMSTLN